MKRVTLLATLILAALWCGARRAEADEVVNVSNPSQPYLVRHAFSPGNGDAATKLQDMIDAISSNRGLLPPGTRYRLVFPAGTYRFSSAATPSAVLHLRTDPVAGIDNDFITFQGAGNGQTIWTFSDTTRYAVRADNTTGLIFEDLVLRWDTSTFVQGTITAIDPSGAFLEVDIDPNLTTVHADRALVFDPVTRRLKSFSDQIYFDKVSVQPNGHFWATRSNGFPANYLSNRNVEVGDLICLRGEASRAAFSLSGGEDLTIQRVDVTRPPGNAVIAFGVKNLVLDRITAIPEGNDLLSTASDGFHLMACRVLVTVTNCHLEGTGDDAIAIRSKFLPIQRVLASDILELGHGGWRAPIGADARLYRKTDLASYASLRVLTTTANSSAATTVQFTTPIPAGFGIGDYVVVDDWMPDCKVEGCTIRQHWGTAIHLKTRTGVVRGNLVEGSSRAGILIGPDFGFFEEAGFARSGFTITENTVRDCGYQIKYLTRTGGIAVTVSPDNGSPPQPNLASMVRHHGTMEITNNLVERCGHSALMLVGVTDATVTGNRFYGCQSRSLLDYRAPGSGNGPHGTRPGTVLGYVENPTQVISLVNSSVHIEQNEIDADGSSQAWTHDDAAPVVALNNERVAFLRFEPMAPHFDWGMPGGWPQIPTGQVWATLPAVATHAPIVGGSVNVSATSALLFGADPTYRYTRQSQTANLHQVGSTLEIGPISSFGGATFYVGKNLHAADWTLDVELVQNGQVVATPLTISAASLVIGQRPNWQQFSINALAGPTTVRFRRTSGNVGYVYIDDIMVRLGQF